jgi:HAD superfamily hydrolase (TIGR01509 family)
MFAMAGSLQKNGYKTAVLSNTEVPAMQFFFLQRYEMFDAAVFSCLEGIKKPDREIYEITLHKLGSRPEQAVLIDDKQQYLNGAKDAGINTILFQNIDQVKGELNRIGAKID